MTHLELENLASEYLEGRLEGARLAQAEAHLAECAACRELVADLRSALAMLRSAEEVEPAPWLVSKILLATVGECKPTWRERWAAFLRPSPQPRVSYAIAMAIFSISLLINAAGVELRNLSLSDLNPRNLVHEARRTGYLLLARAEKYYYDLRVVYEIESRFRELRSEPREGEEGAPERETPPGGSTDTQPVLNPELASLNQTLKVAAGLAEAQLGRAGAGRSPTP
jgi:hypothetical protein